MIDRWTDYRHTREKSQLNNKTFQEALGTIHSILRYSQASDHNNKHIYRSDLRLTQKMSSSSIISHHCLPLPFSFLLVKIIQYRDCGKLPKCYRLIFSTLTLIYLLRLFFATARINISFRISSICNQA